VLSELSAYSFPTLKKICLITVSGIYTYITNLTAQTLKLTEFEGINYCACHNLHSELFNNDT